MEANRTKDALQVEKYTNIKARIRSISLVHDHLYRTSSTDTLDLRQFIKELMDVLMACYGKEYACELATDIQPVRISARVCVDFGLIITELVSNSFKFAIIPRGKGRISIEARCLDGELTLDFADDGPGFPADFLPEKAASVGFRMLMRQVASYAGNLRIMPGGPARIGIRLRLPQLD
jgi:two-component sensor histidine kinase